MAETKGTQPQVEPKKYVQREAVAYGAEVPMGSTRTFAPGTRLWGRIWREVVDYELPEQEQKDEDL